MLWNRTEIGVGSGKWIDGEKKNIYLVGTFVIKLNDLKCSDCHYNAKKISIKCWIVWWTNTFSAKNRPKRWDTMLFHNDIGSTESPDDDGEEKKKQSLCPSFNNKKWRILIRMFANYEIIVPIAYAHNHLVPSVRHTHSNILSIRICFECQNIQSNVPLCCHFEWQKIII